LDVCQSEAEAKPAIESGAGPLGSGGGAVQVNGEQGTQAENEHEEHAHHDEREHERKSACGTLSSGCGRTGKQVFHGENELNF
jgi:hypothetical protein